MYYDKFRRPPPLLFVMVAILLATIGLTAPQPAWANNEASRNGEHADCVTDFDAGVNYHDPNPHTFYYADLTVEVRAAAEWARVNVIDTTTIDTTVLSSPSSATDVVVNDQDYTTFCGQTWHPLDDPLDDQGGAIVGFAPCASLTSDRSCEKYEVRIDLSYSNTVDANHERSLLCHELGHTLGLTHGHINSCMYWQTAAPGLPAPERIDDHDLWMVNDAMWRLHSSNHNTPSYFGEGQRLSSPSGNFNLWLQGDGNLVLYDSSGRAVWAAGKNNPWSNWVYMQNDGNFVQYASDGFGTWPVCSTRTNSTAATVMKLQDDGNLVLYVDWSGQVLWSRFGGGTCS